MIIILEMFGGYNGVDDQQQKYSIKVYSKYSPRADAILFYELAFFFDFGLSADNSVHIEKS